MEGIDLDNLSTEEQNTIFALPFYVAILIASADGRIDDSEIKKTISIVKEQTRKETQPSLTQYYNNIYEDFEDKLKIIISNTPQKNTERSLYLSKKIIDANVVLKKLDKSFVADLHSSLRNLARQIAMASGGVLGYGSIGEEELSLIGLNFLDSAT